MTDLRRPDSSPPEEPTPTPIARPVKPPVERRGYSLTGSYSAKLSGGRTRFVLPSVWRDVIRVPIKVGPCPYREGVRVYPLDEFERLTGKIEEQRDANEAWARDLWRWLARHYYEMEPDTAGRIEVPSQILSSFTWPPTEVELEGGLNHILIAVPVVADALAYAKLPTHIPTWM